MKMNAFPVLAVLATLAGCVPPTTDSDEAIGEVSQALCEDVPPPVGYWTFNNCYDNIVPNAGSARPSLEATLLNGATCNSGYSGYAGIFDGVGARAEIADDSALDFTNEMTISAWVKPNNTSAPQTIVGKWYAPDSYMLWLSNGSYRCSVALAGGGNVSVAGPATANDYSHVMCIFDGSYLRLYINEVEQAYASAVGTLQASTRPVTIGNHPTWNPFAGEIDEVQLYNVALTYQPLGGQTECLGCPNPEACCRLWRRC